MAIKKSTHIRVSENNYMRVHILKHKYHSCNNVLTAVLDFYSIPDSNGFYSAASNVSDATDFIKVSSEKHIRVSLENHSRIMELGKFGDSFNDILTRVLDFFEDNALTSDGYLCK